MGIGVKRIFHALSFHRISDFLVSLRAINKYYLFPIIFSILVNYFWYRGLPIYAGDQGILIAKGVNLNYLIRGLTVAYTNYPYGYVPVVGYTSWVNAVFIPFIPLGNWGEEVLSTLLSVIGSVYLMRVSLRYYTPLQSIFSVFIYLTNWYLYEGFIEAPYIFYSQTFIYFLLPVIVYYLIQWNEKKIETRKAYPILSIILSYLLASSGEYFPIAWLGFTLLVLYLMRKRLVHALLLVLTYTVSQFYWIFSYGSAQISYFTQSNVSNSSLNLIIHESSTPLFQSFTGLLSGFLPYSSNFLFTVITSVIVLLSFIFVRKQDLKYLSIIYIIIVGFDSVIYTPFFTLVKEAVLSNGFFAVLRTTQFSTATFAGFILSLLLPSLIVRKYEKVLFALLLVIFILFNLPVIDGSMSFRVNVPNYYIELVNYLNSQQGHFTVVVFPVAITGWYSTTWYYGNNIYNYYSNNPVVVGGIYSAGGFRTPLYELNFYIYSLSNTTNSSVSLMTIYNILYLMNVKYIIIEGDAINTFNYSHVNVYFTPINKYFSSLSLLEKLHLVKFVKEFGPLYLYEVTINSSYVYYAKSLDFSLLTNLSEVLIPANYKWISPSEIEVPESKYHYVLVTFAYSPYWNSTVGEPENFMAFNLYETHGKSIIIYNVLQGELEKSDIIGLMSVTLPIPIGFILDIFERKYNLSTFKKLVERLIRLNTL